MAARSLSASIICSCWMLGRCALNEGGNDLLRAQAPLARVRAVVGKVDPSLIETVQHSHARLRVLHPLRATQDFPGFRGTAPARTSFPRALAKAAARSLGETLCGPCNSTTRVPDHSS